MHRIRTLILVAVAALLVQPAVLRGEDSSAPRPIQGIEVVVPQGAYALVTMDFDVPAAPQGWRQWRYVGPMRDGRMPMDHGIGIRRPGGWLELDDGRLTGRFRHVTAGAASEQEVVIQARVLDGRIEGTVTVGELPGALTGRIVTERELAERNAITTAGEWPSFLGPVGGGVAARPTRTGLIDGPDQIEMVWRSEEIDIGQGIGSISRFMHDWRDANGRRTGSGSSSPVLADGRVYLSYYVPSPGTAAATGGRSPGMAALPQAIERLAEQSGLAPSDLPIHAMEKVWEATDEVVLAMDAATGRTIWKAVMPGRGWNLQHHKIGPFNMTPAVGGGRVFAIGLSGNLYALDAATGEGLWEHPLALSARSLYSATAQVVGELVVAPYRNRWAGFDAASGELRWHSAVPVAHATMVQWSRRAGPVLLGGAGDEIVAIDARDGEPLWSIPARVRSGGRGLGSGGLAVHRDRLLGYVEGDGEQSGQVFAVAWQLGDAPARELWRVAVEALHPGAVPVVVRDRYLFTVDLQVVDLASGEVLGRGQGTKPGNGGYLQAMNDLVFVRRDGTHGRIETCIYRVGPDGGVTNLTPQRDWSPPTGGGTTSYHHPIMYPLADGRIFLRQRDGIYCWDLRRPAADPRVTAAMELAEAGRTDPAARQLADLLRDDAQGVRLQALQALGTLGAHAAPAASALLDLLAEPETSPLSREASSVLQQMGDAAGPAILEAADHEHSQVRRQAWTLLSRMEHKPAGLQERVASAAADDPDPDVRKAARDCYGSLGAQAVPGLLAWIQGEDPQLRRAGFLTLQRVGSDAMEAVDVLLPMLERRESDGEVYELALQTLLHIGPPGPLPPSAEPGLQALMLQTGGTSSRAADYLHRYGERMIPFFLDCLDQEDHTGGAEYRIILMAAHALSLYGAEAAHTLPTLRETLNKPWQHRAHFVPDQLRQSITTIERASRPQP